MARDKKPRSRTDLIVSVVVHAIVIGGIFYWAAKTGIIPEEISRAFNIAQNKKPAPPKPKPIEPPKATKQEVKNAILPAAAAPPSSAGPSVKMADPNALGPRGDAMFGGAAVRDPNAGPASAIQGQGKMGGAAGSTAVAAPRVLAPKLTGLSKSQFSKDAIRTSTVASLHEERKSASAAQDAISSEQISRSGATDAGAVVSKVAGASIVEGKFVVVRGLSDRYNITTVNGGTVPTADPYRKAAQLDLIPSVMVDRIVVNKTFTPDQPGGFAGGAVNVVTKSFPSKPFVTLSIGGEYNTQASLRDDFLTDLYPDEPLPAALDGVPLAAPPPLAPRNQTPATAALRQAQADAVIAQLNSFQTTQFAPVKSSSPLNHNFSLAMGDSMLLLGGPFGAFATMSYKHDYAQYLDGVSARYDNTLTPYKILSDDRGVDLMNRGAAVNLAWQALPDHEFAFTFINNQNSSDTARRRQGTVEGHEGEILDLSTLEYIERKLTSFLLKGQHKFPGIAPDLLGGRPVEVDWLGALSTTSQEEPDLRYFNYFRAPDGSFFRFAGGDQDLPDRPTRFFRYLEENNSNFKIDGLLPFSVWNGLTAELKAGFFLSNTERTYNQDSFEYRSTSPAGQPPYPGFIDPTDPNTFLNPGVLDYTTQVTARGTNYFFPRYLGQAPGGNQSYDGTEDIQAFYGMLTLPVNERVRLIGGVRLETTSLQVKSQDISSGTTSIDQTDPLPALAAVISLRSNLDLRLSAAQTITRPTFREVANVTSYDPPTDTLLRGNPNLKISSIKNYDARLEYFPRPGEILAFTAFYKQITDPIEKSAINQEGNILTYDNFPTTPLYGIEIEARKQLDFVSAELRYFSTGLNFSLIKSAVPLSFTEKFNKGPYATDTRPLYDQSPYILNTDFTFFHPRWGTSVTVNLALAGERIFFVNPAGPDVYEHPPMALDLIVSQRLWRNSTIRLTAKNLLDAPFLVTYGTNPDQYIYTRFTRGVSFGLNFTYTF